MASARPRVSWWFPALNGDKASQQSFSLATVLLLISLIDSDFWKIDPSESMMQPYIYGLSSILGMRLHWRPRAVWQEGKGEREMHCGGRRCWADQGYPVTRFEAMICKLCILFCFHLCVNQLFGLNDFCLNHVFFHVFSFKTRIGFDFGSKPELGGYKVGETPDKDDLFTFRMTRGMFTRGSVSS